MTKGQFSRRGVVGGAAALAAAAGFPAILRAQPAAVKVGLLHPVTGFLAYNGAQCRIGCKLAMDDVNAAGGIKALGGAKLEAVLGDSQSKPEIGAAETEKMNEAGVNAIIGTFSSSIALAATQTAAKYDLPFLIDVAVSDRIVQRGLKNVFRFKAGFGSVTADAVDNLGNLNKAAGSPAKTAILVHEESEFGTGTAKLLSELLPKAGIEVMEVIKNANPTRNFDNIVLRIKSAKPDLVIPSNYQNEYQLLLRTLRQQKVNLVALYSVLGAGFGLKFAKDMPDVAENVIDFNHWYDQKNPRAKPFRKRVEDKGQTFSYEILCSYNAVKLLADALERAGSVEHGKVIAALETSAFSDHFMPYGPTKFVDGQNQGARCVAMQVQKGDIEVVYPPDYQTAPAIYPAPKAG